MGKMNEDLHHLQNLLYRYLIHVQALQLDDLLSQGQLKLQGISNIDPLAGK
jgi:hypothetical protein